MRYRLAAAIALGTLILTGLWGWAAQAQAVGTLNDASLTASTTAANINFTKPRQTFVQICNDDVANKVGINPTGTAVIGSAGTHTLLPGGCQTFESAQIPTNTWSVVANGASTPVAVWYR